MFELDYSDPDTIATLAAMGDWDAPAPECDNEDCHASGFCTC